jgi:hypothetical protein
VFQVICGDVHRDEVAADDGRVSGYSVSGQDLYAAIWEKISGPAFVARHGMTSQLYQQEFDKLSSAGFRLTLVDAY